MLFYFKSQRFLQIFGYIGGLHSIVRVNLRSRFIRTKNGLHTAYPMFDVFRTYAFAFYFHIGTKCVSTKIFMK